MIIMRSVEVLASTDKVNVILNMQAARTLLDRLRGGDPEPGDLVLLSDLMGLLTDVLEPEPEQLPRAVQAPREHRQWLESKIDHHTCTAECFPINSEC